MLYLYEDYQDEINLQVHLQGTVPYSKHEIIWILLFGFETIYNLHHLLFKEKRIKTLEENYSFSYLWLTLSMGGVKVKSPSSAFMFSFCCVRAKAMQFFDFSNNINIKVTKKIITKKNFWGYRSQEKTSEKRPFPHL